MTMPGPDGLNRAVTEFPVHLMKTYQVVAPRATHWRPATCEEYGCGAWLHGWRTVVPADSPQADYIRRDRTRRHTEERQADGLAAFTFGPGQHCFAASRHQVPNGRPERYIERGGDWRGNPVRQHRELTAADWVDSFAANMISIAGLHERG